MKSLNNFEELIVFDCETTGLDPFNNHIIELGCCRYELTNGEFELAHQFNRLIKINYSLPERIIDITGITDVMLFNNGHNESDVAQEFVKDFINNSTKRKLYIAYNAPFDINFVNQLLSRNNYPSLSNVDFLDLLTVYKDRAQYPHRLENAISHYHLTNSVKNSHRAIDDVIASFEVLRTMAEECDDIDKYVNLFGYNPKYSIQNRIKGVRYAPQYYNSRNKLYN